MHKRHFKLQKPLCLYIDKHVDVYRKEAAEVFIYVAHVILEAALTSNPKPRRISVSTIQRAEADLAAGELSDFEFHLTNYSSEAFAEIDDVALGVNEVESMLDSINVLTMCIHKGMEDAAR